ncbi:MAG: hypothetical protein HDR27_11535, partial [Lachnospiraceae bacterium]|nr:hypothetical protein [Lachnospiraceae bacterium]
MKNLRRLAVVSVFLILVFMVIALLQYQNREEASLLPNQFEYSLYEDWTIISLGAEEDWDDFDGLSRLVEEALTE